MGEGTSVSLVDLGALAKPADTLIKKASAAVGGLAAPWHIRRVAQARADAVVIAAEADVQAAEIHERALARSANEEIRHQQHMESVAARSIPHLSENATPDAIDDDWLLSFFAKCRLVSSEEMQELWARILAGEANKPGRYSRRTVSLLADLDREDANAFQNLCKFVWHLDDETPLILNYHDEIYNVNGVSFSTLNHLKSIGLVHFDPVPGFARQDEDPQLTASYRGRPLHLKVLQSKTMGLNIGSVLFTQTGRELSGVCDQHVVEGVYEYIAAEWNGHLRSNEAG